MRFTFGVVLVALGCLALGCTNQKEGTTFEQTSASDGGATGDEVFDNARARIENGRNIFRFDTFGDEAFWTERLQLDRAIAGEANGGVGPGLSPSTALELGLKVDASAVPQEVATMLQQGQLDLEDPANTLALLRAKAVVGVSGQFAEDGSLTSIGITCALCHSTVDDSFAPGIGQRRDGWPNRDLNVGAIIALSPSLEPFTEALEVDDATVREVLESWGPGKFDAELILDGKAFRPDGGSAATLIPAAFGMSGVNLATYTGWGTATYWNAFVANLEMRGQGVFFDPRLDDASQFPVAARERLGHVHNTPDLITPRLADLHLYQLALPVPKPPADSFDQAAAERGQAIFDDKARCAGCHVPPLYTEPGWNLHTPEEIGIDDFQANRAPDRRYRTTPLNGLFTRAKGGFYHDGRFPDLPAVVDHYDDVMELGLSGEEKTDLVEFLKSL
jgi:hypothetical protein